MKIADLKQPYRRIAEYLADKNYIEEASNRIYNLYKQGSIMDIFCRTINSGNYPPITEEIKKHFPPDFDFSDMGTTEFSKTKTEELKEILEKEGNQKTHQFQEWWYVFEILSYGRKLQLSELEMHSILSNRFELKRK